MPCRRIATRLLGWTGPARWVSAFTSGWSEEIGAFTQTFDGWDSDASSLMIPIVGFLPPDDARVLSTIDAVRERLKEDAR